MDVQEMATKLGGMVVGLELSTMQVPRASINREPQKVMQDKHHTHQQEQVKEWNKVDQIVLEPSKEHRQMHGKLSLDMKEDLDPTWVDHEIGSKDSTKEHGEQDRQEEGMQNTEEVKHRGRCDGHHPGGGIRHQKEVGLMGDWDQSWKWDGWRMDHRVFLSCPC